MIFNYNELSLAKLNKSKFNKGVNIEYHTDNKIKEKYKDINEEIIRLNTNVAYFINDQNLSLYELYSCSGSFNNWYCTAGGNSLCINHRGRLYNCRTGILQPIKNPLPFTIFDEFEKNYAKLDKIIQCPFDACAEPETIKQNYKHTE